MSTDQINARATEIEEDLLARYGAVMAGRDLRTILGYPSGDAFRHAAQRKTLPIPTFFLKGRRGRCAATRDVARWMALLGQPDSDSSMNVDAEDL
ncbi:hypothetical protein [Dyella agri]|uniref:DNA-binding protein n=1 Tax=Dyella agri TaxID=1926869 RepID=A0ABW8KKC7_9GAMM